MFNSILFLATITVGAFAVGPFYRRDYTYVPEFDAFYKVHWDKDGFSYNTAFLSCDNEGSQLFYPIHKDEWAVVKNLSSKFQDSLNTTEVIVGIHDETGIGEFVTVDGNSTPSPLNLDVKATGDCILMDSKTGIFKTEQCVSEPPMTRLYVCKKIDENPCPTIDSSYKYVKSLKKCYKLNKKERAWPDAYNTCFMEGGTLAFPENYDEVLQIQSLLSREEERQNYHTGFKKLFPKSHFYTVKGKQLGAMQYIPRFSFEDDKVVPDCGIMFIDRETLILKSIDCGEYLPFLCELKSKY